ncbi:MAG: hypothetical protein AAF512_09875 [Pseudomonadota bacterium]
MDIYNKRWGGLIAIALLACLLMGASIHAAESSQVELTPGYAESVAAYGMTPDGSGEVHFRLARFPERGKGTVWLSMFINGQFLNFVDDDVNLPPGDRATPIKTKSATFKVAFTERYRVTTFDRHSGKMIGYITADALAHTSPHPLAGNGTVPVSLKLEFRAIHSGIRVRYGRLEIFGTVRAIIKTPQGLFSIEGTGKWHEQTGQRPNFAPRFTYIWGGNKDTGIVARSGPGRHWGYINENRVVTMINEFLIAPLVNSQDIAPRNFALNLADGRIIRGVAHTLRKSSVPIEGSRRPSATIRLESELGLLVVHLNDWIPPVK